MSIFAVEVLPQTEIPYVRCDSNKVWYSDLWQALGINGDTHLIVAMLDFNFFVKNLTWAVQVNLGSTITPRYRTSVSGFTFEDPI